MNNKPNQAKNLFDDIYALIGSAETLSNSVPELKTCRFCGKRNGQTTFNKIAHACPELLGQNDFIIYDECDSCNEKFSKYESHLSKFFMPYLSIIGVKGKRKIPEFHSRTEKGNDFTRTVLKYNKEGKIDLVLGSSNDYEIDEINKRMSVKFRTPPIIPIYIYKALVKIALSYLPKQKTQQYRLLFDWLLDNDSTADYFPILFITKLTRKKFSQPFVQLFEARNIFTDKGFYPELTLVINFGNIAAQIFLPLSEYFDYPKSNGKSPTLELYPAFIYNVDMKKYRGVDDKTPITVKYKFDTIDLNCEKSIVRDEVMNFTFDRVDFNTPQ